MNRKAYNELYQSVWEVNPDQWEESPYYHRGGDEGYPWSDYALPGFGRPGVETLSDLDRRENRQADGKEFDEVKSDERRGKRLNRLQELKKALKDKKNKIPNPHNFYSSEYGSFTGIDGLYSYPDEYYSGTIADSDTTTGGGFSMINPWQDIYQSASDNSERIKIRAFFLSPFMIRQ